MLIAIPVLSETNRVSQAKKQYGLSMATNSLLWSSIRAYYQLGGENTQQVPKRALTRRGGGGVASSDKSVVDWLSIMTEVQEQLSQFKCKEALSLLETVPTVYQNLSFTMRLKGMILFEIPDNRRCSEVFRELRRLYPTRIEVAFGLTIPPPDCFRAWRFIQQHCGNFRIIISCRR